MRCARSGVSPLPGCSLPLRCWLGSLLSGLAQWRYAWSSSAPGQGRSTTAGPRRWRIATVVEAERLVKIAAAAAAAPRPTRADELTLVCPALLGLSCDSHAVSSRFPSCPALAYHRLTRGDWLGPVPSRGRHVPMRTCPHACTHVHVRTCGHALVRPSYPAGQLSRPAPRSPPHVIAPPPAACAPLRPSAATAPRPPAC